MLKEKDEGEAELTGNDQFEGYCLELADMLADDLGFSYEIKLVGDKQYGSLNKQTNTWNGMIGEIKSGVRFPVWFLIQVWTI